MNPIVSIMAQGSMGAATAQRLTEHGVEVRTIVAGRSAASAGRAKKAGMKAVGPEEFVAADFILSIVPPAQAIPLARELAPAIMAAEKKPIYVDLNAISPDTTMMVEMIVAPAHCRFVDGGIIGGPPRAGYDGPVYYVSGMDAPEVMKLAPFGLKIGVLDAPVGAASALKMSYAGITKGLIALGSSMILAAERAGISEALFTELSASQPTLVAGLSKSVPDMFTKANRWVAEMQEIAAFTGTGRPEHEIYVAIAELYSRLGKDNDGAKAETDVLKVFFQTHGRT